MGYFMSQMQAKFKIKKENQEKALAAIKTLMNKTDLMSGGGTERKWFFSWVDTDRVKNANNLISALRAWRWDAECDDNGDIVDIRFVGENLGDDEQMLNAIAPFVEEGSYIQMIGEDNSIWQWLFKNGTCVEVPGHLVFKK